MEKGEVIGIKPYKGMSVFMAYCKYSPKQVARDDNGHELVTRVKTTRGKMIIKNFNKIKINEMNFKIITQPAKRVVLRADECIIFI